MIDRNVIKIQAVGLSCLLIFFISFHANAQKKRLSCVGNSITAGYGLTNPSQDSYPSQLSRLLGSTSWTVGNYGSSGRTMLKGGGYSYWDDSQYASALNSTPNTVVIGLGTNDSKNWLWDWLGQSEFKTDYKLMVQSFQSLSTKPDIWIFLLVPGEKSDWGIFNSYIGKVNVKIKEIALEMGLGLIDQHSVFAGHWPGWFQTDSVHPTVEGAYNIALNVQDMLLRTKPEVTYSNGIITSPDGIDYQWYINGIAVSSANGGIQREMAVTQLGTYKVSIRLASTSETRIVSKEYNVSALDGIDTKTVNNNIKVYPNPVSDTLYIDLENMPVSMNYSISDLSGAVALSGRIEKGNRTINIGKLPSGTFLLSIDNGCIKFIKK